MRRCDLDRPGSKLGIHEGIGNDFDFPVYQRKDQGLSDQGTVAFVVRIDGDRRIPQHGLGTGGRDNHAFFFIILKGIPDVIEVSLDIPVLGLFIREGCQTARTPINDVFAAVDESLLVEGDKDMFDRVAVGFIHGKAGARPVT